MDDQKGVTKEDMEYPRKYYAVKEKLIELVIEGKNQFEIAAELDIDRSSVHRYLSYLRDERRGSEATNLAVHQLVQIEVKVIKLTLEQYKKAAAENDVKKMSLIGQTLNTAVANYERLLTKLGSIDAEPQKIAHEHKGSIEFAEINKLVGEALKETHEQGADQSPQSSS